jgi:hypothetical protein
MSERKLERFVYETGKPTARTNDQGMTRGGVAVRLGYGSPPTPDIAECIARPDPRVASHATNEGREMKSESQRKLRGAAE